MDRVFPVTANCLIWLSRWISSKSPAHGFPIRKYESGRGRDNSRDYFKNNPELSAELEKLVREGLKSAKPSTPEKSKKTPIEIPIEAAAKMSASSAKTSIDISVDD